MTATSEPRPHPSVAGGRASGQALWREIQADHDRIWDLLNFLTGGGGEPEGTVRQRRLTALELVALESRHEVAEELVFWPAVRQMVPDGDQLADEAIGQEREAKRALNEFQRIRPASQDFLECLHAIAGMARAHITFEQNQVWPALDYAMTPADAAELAQRWAVERRRAPTRPHPHTPASPAVLGSVGRLAALSDKALDVLGRRRRVISG